MPSEAIATVTPTDAEQRERLVSLIDRQLVAPVFQPIVCLQTGEVAGFEALARPAPGSGFAHAGELFEQAERLGMLWPLEQVTRAKCLAAAAEFPEGVLLFLNSTPSVFADPRFAGELERAVRETRGLVPGRMVLEITEASDEQVFVGLVEQVKSLAATGYQVAIDDAGAGTSGLKRMLLLRPHWLKLDRALIESVDRDPFQHNFIRFLVHFARMSGVSVVAEGIERREQLGTLIDLGVRYGQGFLLANPAAGYQLLPEDLREWVRRRWSQRLITPGNDPNGTPVGTLARPAAQIQAGEPLSDAAAQLTRSAEHAGFVVLDGRRYVGWCSRAAVLLALAKEPARTPIGFVTPTGPASIAPDASLSEALELVSTREEVDLAAPLVVSDEERVFGVVPLRTLMWAAGGQASQRRGHRLHPLTGLPNQVAADHRVSSLLQHAQDGESLALDQDAAYVDLRDFESFNAQHGYDMGDQLLVDLARMLNTIVNEHGPTGFVAHLSGDRFLVLGPSARMGGWTHEFVERFDRSLSEAGVGRELTGQAAVRLRLRVLWMPRAFARIHQARELSGMERQLRGRARLMEERDGDSASLIVRDDTWDAAAPLRLSA